MASPFDRFADVVTDMNDLRAVLPEPMKPVTAKVIHHIDDISRQIIELSPFVVIASADGNGYPDISPKGDPGGFIQVLDENTLVFPDRPGNRRLDTLTNLLQNPYLAIIFLIPGKAETLRVTGECRIVRDAALRESLAVNGRAPNFAVVMHVERVLIHCPKCVMRSKLWDPEAWPDSSHTANISEAMIAHAKLEMTEQEFFEAAKADNVVDLY